MTDDLRDTAPVQIRQEHVRMDGYAHDEVCATDGQIWPCAVGTVIAAWERDLARLRAIEAAARPIVDMRPAVDIVTGLREQVAILRAALEAP